MIYKDYTAKTLDEAITMASVDLGVISSELSYEIIEKGSNGILGLGRKDVVIRAARISDLPDPDEDVKNEKKAVVDNTTENNHEEISIDSTEIKEENHKRHEREYEFIDTAEREKISNVAKEFLSQVFKDMSLEVEITTEFHEKDNSLSIDMKGDHMGIIIGKRGQTLDSLQYLVNLVVNKNSNSFIRIKLDTEDYRRRRKETLENLAKNIAFKVKRTGKPVTLEAMNPYERRTIHYALQRDRFVTTYSEGEEPYRHVVVVSKK